MRRILIILTVLVGVLVLALVIFVASFDANRYKPELTSLVENYTGRKLAIAGDLKLSVWPRLALSMGRTALSEADGKGEAARFDSGRVAVALRPLLSRELVIEGLALNGLQASFGSPDANANASAGARADARQRWRLENAKLRTGRIASGEPDKLSLEGRLASPTGDVDVALKLESRYLADFGARTLKLEELDARLEGVAGGARNLHAQLAANLLADLATRRIDANALSIEASVPDGPQLALAGTGKLALNDGTAEIGLAGHLDDSKLKLNANATRLEPLALRYELVADQIDVGRLRQRVRAALNAPGGQAASAEPTSPAAEPASGAPPVAPSPAAVPTESSPLAALAPIANTDTEGSLKIGHLQVSGLTFDGVSASSRSGSGQVAIDPLTAQLNGGKLQARLSMDANGPRVAATLTGVDAGALIRDASKRDVVDGRGDIQLDLTATGNDQAAWLPSLAGSASLALRGGTVKGIDLSQLMQQVQSALGGGAVLEERVKALAHTPFSALTGNFKIASGVARTDNLDLNADWLRATGAGQANLDAGSLDLLIRATVTGIPGGTPGSAALRDIVTKLKGVTVPVHVTGHFDDLSYKVELKDLAAGAVKRELTRRLGEQLGVPIPGAAPATPGSPGRKSKDPLERLRGLLKR